MVLSEAVGLSKTFKTCPEWREFKKKWDNNIPRINSEKYMEYVKDCISVHKALEKFRGDKK